MNSVLRSVSALCLGVLAGAAAAAEFDTTVALQNKGKATYYVSGQIPGMGPVDLMVDTGSGYTTINEETLEALRASGRARYVRDLVGVLANGSKMVVKIYSVSAINIGGDCWVHDVEAAVFPGRTRHILGLNALAKTAPFIFSIDPPELVLSNCSATPPAAETAASSVS
ncbi:MAG: clan AA aspartic protease [Gammaproteobacteria bacterium]|nr:clan AA aspartic protease [Gammaproteobacteria bacterium]NIR31078.1 clan AA aspartic protease [Gammaproteobacteria bacterium]NIR98533.1 clan AA aspartic protease [Gammaproteobacteria bacterium]NIT64255.1 clan AA aspartic protease [Gammaproteobacteria bacterium]NIV21860.1 hypothetical protein [Gammaproteobacteria bacterium]